MEFFLTALFILTLIYALFISWCIKGWRKIIPSVTDVKKFGTLVSIVVPARNEEENIAGCLRHLISQNYPPELFEIIVVNDHSTDGTAGIAESIRQNNPTHKIVLLNYEDEQNVATHKKQAITNAIQNSFGELIVTTDADCEMAEGWLSSIVSYYESKSPDMISAPVCMRPGKNIFEKLQRLEFMGLIGIGAGSISNLQPMMCNGANLAYSKKIFYEVNGFAASTLFPSGDDTQLMMKIAEKGASKIHFIKSTDAIVYTKAVSSTNELIHQRKRWASKIPSKMSPFVLLMGCVAYAMHAGLLIILISALFDYSYISIFLFLFSIKIIPEFIFLFILSDFFLHRKILWLFLPAQFIYMIYILYIGSIAPFNSYRWKGRTIKAESLKFHRNQ